LDRIPTSRFFEPSIQFPVTIHYTHDRIYLSTKEDTVELTNELRAKLVRSYERRHTSGT
jgi:hypothetical protein